MIHISVVWSAWWVTGSLLESSGSSIQLYFPSIRICYTAHCLCKVKAHSFLYPYIVLWPTVDEFQIFSTLIYFACIGISVGKIFFTRCGVLVHYSSSNRVTIFLEISYDSVTENAMKHRRMQNPIRNTTKIIKLYVFRSCSDQFSCSRVYLIFQRSPIYRSLGILSVVA